MTNTGIAALIEIAQRDAPWLRPITLKHQPGTLWFEDTRTNKQYVANNEAALNRIIAKTSLNVAA